MSWYSQYNNQAMLGLVELIKELNIASEGVVLVRLIKESNKVLEGASKKFAELIKSLRKQIRMRLFSNGYSSVKSWIKKWKNSSKRFLTRILS